MLTLNFDPFPELSTARLILKRITSADLQELFAIRSNKETMRFIPRPIAKVPADAQTVIDMIDTAINNNEGINWGLYPKDTNKLIGVLGYVRINKGNARAEVGYVLNADFHRKGYTEEALNEILNYGFTTLNFNCIEAVINPENTPSVRLIEKLNFIKEGRFRDFTFHNEEFSDAFIYSKLKRENTA
ncbi:MAG: GNAT family N-acetyltransferase [Bacteroidetes bacterium]|nr:GNAT family N-acetyltransferase [Bacteroidota bacterium]